ncbi:MAG: zinc-ribbon domain-containing protein [Clostridiales bacterium]|nr:zinc-ribbon domain-containing protein [Clostridiales bacterium]
MARFCTECGKEIAEGVAFCTECGTKAPAEPPVQPKRQTVRPIPQPSAHPKPQSPAMPVKAERGDADTIVGTGSFFGILFLCGIPLLGLIISIVIAIAAKNRNRKNLAKAMILWNVIGLVLAGLLVLVIHLISGPLMEFINQQLGGIMGELGGEAGIGGMLDQFGEFSEILELLKNGGFEGMEGLEGLENLKDLPVQ